MQSIDTIEAISIYKLFVPLKEPFVISLGPIHHVQNIVVVIKTKRGITGFGECSPYMTIKTKTFASLSCALALSFGFAGAVHAAGPNAISVKNAWVRWLPCVA